MNLREIRSVAREKMKGYCRVCPVCNGVACAGEVPGMGGSLTGSTFKNNVDDLNKVKLRLKTIHNAKDPNLEFEFFDSKLDFPIITAPITGSAFNMGGALTEREYIDSVVNGSLSSGTIAMIGDSADLTMYEDGLNALKKVEGKGVPIIKPRENQAIIENIKKAESINSIAVGVDIDGAGLVTMALKGQPVGPKTVEELKELVSSTNLPFILKGIMTVEEAELAVEIGAKAIVVSNHGGRVLDHAESTAKVLPEISKAVKGKIMILVDGGVRSGVDVFKMLSLGADGVLIGRPIIIGAFGGYEEGVSLILDNMKNELYQTMILTGCKDLASIDSSNISVEW
ncbi:alpha-hydroxy-acid oxidizing protein [Anaerosalibacter massiliensis]|uniref:L-lactate oxidase n=1 Tax=Anaerosalibacter massiliensis TaxID=1347392 RepID=A0A9X2S5M5_9FIRM|nr:alpha-hydroxy-acid oxidizing protein [Anaerosalibacter massiliensis]MCR2044745.1 alpha-hydroxy-acid oxidizing protein [Anaerosalibacter massiliensis]